MSTLKLYAKVDAPAKKALHAEMTSTTDARWYCRLKVIDLTGQGFSLPELTQLFDLATCTSRRFLHAYNQAGVDNLRLGYGQGQLLAVTWTKKQWLNLLTHSPADLALLETGDQNWCQITLCVYLARYHQVSGA